MNYFNIKQYKNKIGLLLACLVTTGLCAITANAQSKSDSCYVVPKGDGLLIQVSKSDGQESVLGALGTDKVQAIAFNATADTLFGAQIGRMGIIDINTGNFTALSMNYGTGNGSLGLIDFIQVEGLTYDALSKELLGTAKVEGSDDILLKINPATGAHIPDAFGAGVDYVTISGPGVLPTVEDLAIDPNTGILYALSRETVGNDLLITVNKNTGAANVVGPLGEKIIEGLGFDLEGRLFATPGAQTSPPTRFYEINKKTGKATTIAALTVSIDYESCDCLTTPYEVNRSPNAEDDTFVTQVNQELIVEASGVLANDFDPDGDTLVVIDFNQSSTDGSVQVNPDGSFTYTPVKDSTGTDSFTYIVSDNKGNTDTAVVNITVVTSRNTGETNNNPPMAADDELMTDQDLELIITDPAEGVLVNDTDPDGDQISVQEVNNAITDQGGRISINTDGTLNYVPPLGFIGRDTYEYTVCDDQEPALCDSATIYIEVKELPVEVFNAFSPNGDGVNDTWIIQGITRFPNNEVQIFNRWGNLVFKVTGYNNSTKVWDGNSTEGIVFGSNGAPDGAYFYVITLGDGSERISGYVVVRR